MNNKTAKDLAWDRERATYKKQIKCLNDQLRQKDKELEETRMTIHSLAHEIRSKQEWIERLLEFTELSPEELENFIHNQEKTAKLSSLLSVCLSGITPKY